MGALPEIGETIDDMYEIIEQIGQGGFGAVFRARHIPMDRDVALKMLLTHGPKPDEMIERFKREVMAIRNLSHPNTVRIFDYRDYQNQSTLYYTMEYLKGLTLKDVTRQEGPQSPRRVRHILRQIAKSLAEAHSYGIVHRDLKPANVMLVDMHGEVDFVKVLDFGIAKVMDANEDDEDEPLTSAGMLVGTLRYMSPEQIKGEPLGPYTDIYALGLIAAELIAGHSVFAGTGRWEILQKQVSNEPIQISAELAGSPLYNVLQRMLAKDVNVRYATTTELLQDLGAIPIQALSDQPLLIATPLPASSSNSNISHLNPPHTPSSQSISALSANQAVPSARVLANAPNVEHMHVPAGHTMEDAPTMIASSDSFEQPLTNFGFKPPEAVGISPSATPKQATHDTDSFEAQPTKSNTPLLVAIALLSVLVLGAGAFVLLSGDKAPKDPQEPPIAANSLDTKQSDTAAPNTPEPTTEKPSKEEKELKKPPTPEPKAFVLRLKNKDISNVDVSYKGTSLGSLSLASPLEHALKPGESKTLKVSAKGYKTKEVKLSYESSPRELVVALEQQQRAAADTKSQKKPKPKTQPKTKTEDELWDIDPKPKTKKKPVKKRKPKDDVWDL